MRKCQTAHRTAISPVPGHLLRTFLEIFAGLLLLLEH